MKKQVWLSLAAVAATVAVGVGTTLALFSAGVSQGTTLTAGTLCLGSDRNDGDRIPGPMFYVTPSQGATPGGLPGIFPTGVWAPGDEHTRTLTVYNPGTCGTGMDAWLTSVEATMRPGGYAPMADKLWVEVWTPMSGSEVKVAEGRLSDFMAGAVPLAYPGGGKVPLYLSSNRHMKFKVKFDLGADNSYQDKSLVIDFAVNAVQMKNNP
jgi:hypothetical protein